MKIKNTYDIIIMTEGSDPVFNVARALGGYKIASALRNEGYSVFVLSNFSHFIQKGNINQILDKLIGDNTLWVGFSSTLFMRSQKDVYRKRHTRDTAKQNMLWHWPTNDVDIKSMTDYIRSKGIKTVYGGMMDAHRAPLVKDCIDYYVVGMGEHAALHISDHIKNGTTLNYNLAYGLEPKVIDYDQRGNLFDFRNAHINYVPEDFWNPEDGMGIEFGRGCIFRCKFCAYPLIGKKKGDLSFLREKERIKDELKQNYELYGTTKYVIIDDTFNEQTIKLQAIADAIDEIDLPEQLQFAAFIRIDLIARYPEQLELLKKINVRAWFLGVESLNYESAKAIGKGCPKEVIFETIRNAKEKFNGSLSVYGSFIAGLPHDSRETMDKWIAELVENKHLFDAFSFSPLELGTASVLSKNPELYGYTIDKSADTANKWTNEHWSADETVEYVKQLQGTILEDIRVSTFFLMFYQCLGFTFDELRVMTFTELFANSKVRRKARQYLEKSYYSKVENFLGVEPTPPNIKYMKNLSIAQNIKDTLKEEFLQVKNLVDVPELEVLKAVEDITECKTANSIVQNVKKIVGCEVYPSFFIQSADSYLKPRTESGATGIQIVLDTDSPITWDEAIDVYYDCSVLDLSNMHSIQTNKEDRIFLHITILDKPYEDVLKIISENESEIFNV